MQPSSQADYRELLTEVIKKQIVILGPDITLSKARNVKGLTIADDGTVTNVTGPEQEVIQSLIDQFVQLSGLIVKKTMEPLLSLSQPVEAINPLQATVAPLIAQPIPTPASNPAPQLIVPPVSPQPVQNPEAQSTPTPEVVVSTQPIAPTNPAEQPVAIPTPQSTPPTPEAQIATPAPAKNPLAA